MILSNIKFKVSDTKNSNGELVPTRIEERMAKIINPLALKYASWEFREKHGSDVYEERVSNQTRPDIIAREANEFEVYCKNEKLGDIGYQNWGGFKYTITNKRIKGVLERGDSYKTSDVAKAIKLVGKHFSPKTTQENLAEITDMASRVLAELAQEKNYRRTNAWRSMQSEAMGFILSNIEMYKQFVSEAKNVTSLLPVATEFPNIIAEDIGASSINSAMGKGQTYTVSIEGDTYSLVRSDKDIQLLSREQVPAYVLQGVGMLKLLEIKQSILGVGTKCADNIFVIFVQEN